MQVMNEARLTLVASHFWKFAFQEGLKMNRRQGVNFLPIQWCKRTTDSYACPDKENFYMH